MLRKAFHKTNVSTSAQILARQVHRACHCIMTVLVSPDAPNFYLVRKAAMQNFIGPARCRSSIPELLFFHLGHISARGIIPTCALQSRRLSPVHRIHISYCA